MQYGQCHAVHAHSLRCVATSEDGTVGNVVGGGRDAVGEFALSGTYHGNRLMLHKQYQLGTGDPTENKGHKVQLRLTVCNAHEVLPERRHLLLSKSVCEGMLTFYGTWHVRTPGYVGSAEMLLWLPTAEASSRRPVAEHSAALAEEAAERAATEDASVMQLHNSWVEALATRRQPVHHARLVAPAAVQEPNDALGALRQPLLAAAKSSVPVLRSVAVPVVMPNKSEGEMIDELRAAHPTKPAELLRAMKLLNMV